VGAGQIDDGDEFRDSLGRARSDKSAFIIGGGASLRLTDRIRLNGAIRDYIMTTDESLDDVATTGDLTHNTMLTAGFTFSFGGRTERPDRARTDTRENERERELRELRAIREERRLLERDARDARAPRDTIRRDRDSVMMIRDARIGGDVRFITVPVPTQGEIILRYGLPLRELSDAPRGDRPYEVRRDSVIVGTPSTDVARSLADIERRLTARLEAIERAQQTPRGDAAPMTPPAVTVVTPGVTATTTPESVPVFRRLGQINSGNLQPYGGIGLRDGDAQIILGARADLGAISVGSGFRFVPELAVGVGSGNTSVLALANVRYTFGSETSTTLLRPYITLGGGVYTPTVLGINTAFGSSFRLREASERPLFLHVELQGLNAFNETRLLMSFSRSR
jgi:hypothetical protein